MVGIGLEKNTLFLCMLVFVSLAVRVYFFTAVLNQGSGSWLVVDSEQYHSIATNLVDGKGFTMDGREQSSYRLPGYSAFLAANYHFFNKSVSAALWVQLIIASIIPALIFFLTLTIFPMQYALARWAAVISSFHVGLSMYSGMLASESLFLLFFLLFLIFFLKNYELWFSGNFWSKQTVLQMLAAGLCLGCASLIRALGHHLLIVGCVMILVSRSTCGRKALLILCFFCSWLLVVGWWLLRNYLLAGALFFHTLPGWHFLQYVGVPIYREIYQVDSVEARRALTEEWKERINSTQVSDNVVLNEYQRAHLAERLAVEYIIKKPFVVFKVACVQLFKTIFAVHAHHLLLIDLGWPAYTDSTTLGEKIMYHLLPPLKNKSLLPFIYLDIILHLMLILGSGCWLIGALFFKRWRELACILPFVAVVWGATLAYGNARLRLPLEPFMIIATCCVVYILVAFFRSRRTTFL